MDHHEGSPPGCGTVFLVGIAIVVLAVVGLTAIFWNSPIGHANSAGDPILVQDYVNAINPFWKPHADSPAGNEGVSDERVNREIFDLMKPGRTTEETMKDYLGPKALVSSSSIGGVVTNAYVVQNRDGSRVSLIFQEGILASKTEIGLK